jgi:hypothetical protein
MSNRASLSIRHSRFGGVYRQAVRPAISSNPVTVATLHSNPFNAPSLSSSTNGNLTAADPAVDSQTDRDSKAKSRAPSALIFHRPYAHMNAPPKTSNGRNRKNITFSTVSRYT